MRAIIYDPKFQKSASKLRKIELDRLARLIKILIENPYHPLLHTKHLTGPLDGILSFRIGRNYRCIFRIIDSETVLLLEISHRKDIYRK